MEKKFQYQVKDRAIVITRKFKAPHENVWNAFTDSKILDQWWAPKPWKCHTKEQQFKVNGRWLYYMQSPEGEIHWSFFNYTKIDPQKSFEGNDGFCDEHGNPSTDMPGSKWKNEFLSADGTCTVTCTCSFDKEESLKAIIEMGFLEGFEMGLNNLEEYLSK